MTADPTAGGAPAEGGTAGPPDRADRDDGQPSGDHDHTAPPVMPPVGDHTSELHHPEGIHSAAEAHVDSDEAQMSPPLPEDAPPVPAAEHQQVVQERDDYLDQLQRARADYDNLNKRRHREVAEARDRGQAALVEGLLEVLDTFGFALQAGEVSEDEQLAKGVRLVHDQLMSTLRQAGLEEVPGTGAPFDPSHHEALMSETDGSDRETAEVAEVLRTGYRFKTHLLRPASVKVVE